MGDWIERAKLTTLAVDRAHRSGKPMLLSDGDGLYLRKRSRDGASWTLRYHFGGREHWLTLGHYPDMSLAQARIEAREARVLLDKQQDPLTVRRAAPARLVSRAVRGVVPERDHRPGNQASERSAPASRQAPAGQAWPHGSGGRHRCGHCPRDRRPQSACPHGSE